MASGRERMGVPKKIADITLERHNDQMVGSVTRSGVTFATMGMTFDTAVSDEQLQRMKRGMQGDSLGYIDQLDEQGDLHRLWLKANRKDEIESAISGRGFVDIRPSASDPLYPLDLRAVSATYIRSGASTLLPSIPVATRRLTGVSA